MGGGSHKLRAWLEQRLRDAEPGSRLPTDKQLATEFGITERTVRSVLRTYRDRDKLVRLPGRGTFIPGQEPRQREIPAGKKSAESLADALYHSIVQGAIRQGQPLPQVKFTCRQFRVAPSTVIAAYRRLEQMGRAVRIGKAYWVGGPGEILQKRQTRKVYLFNCESSDFSAVFCDNYFARAFEKFEKELVVNGYSIVYEDSANLARLSLGWRRENVMPWGLVCVNVNPDRIAALQPHLSATAHHAMKSRGGTLPILIDWSDYINTQAPRGMQVLRREHAVTSTCIELVGYFRETGCRTAHLFLSLSGPTLVYEPEDCIMLYFKLLKEAKLLDPDFRLGCSLLVDGKRRVAGAINRHLSERLGKAGSYTGVDAAEMRKDLAVVDSVEECLGRMVEASTCIFSTDRHALAALAYARGRGLPVPKKLSIVSLQNDPAFLHAGISYCGPDWERIGYSMAHAIMQDIPVDKSTMGYLRTWAFMLHRLTTQA